jgi:tyrosyl-tRNA synthetase
VMSISDDLMWRYYELLTDVPMVQIEQMKKDAAGGKQHPMELKKALARRIVQDFHSEQAAKEADANWAKQFQKDESPDDLEQANISIKLVTGAGSQQEIDELAESPKPPYFLPDRPTVLNASPELQRKLVRLDKILMHAGLAESASDGNRKIKQSAVRINSDVVTVPNLLVLLPARPFVARVGRKMKRIQLID